jgi:hypothetical protein
MQWGIYYNYYCDQMSSSSSTPSLLDMTLLPTTARFYLLSFPL